MTLSLTIIGNILQINLQLSVDARKCQVDDYTLKHKGQLEDDKHESLMIMIPCVVVFSVDTSVY